MGNKNLMVNIEFCEHLEKGYLLENTQQEHFIFCQLANRWNETYDKKLKTSNNPLISALWERRRKFEHMFATFDEVLKAAEHRTSFWKMVEIKLNLPKHNWFMIGIRKGEFNKENMQKEGRCQDEGCKEFSMRRMWTVQLADRIWPDIETIKEDGTKVYTSGW